MPDIVTPPVRSRMMSRVRSKNTRPEMVIRQGLHARGFHYRLHCPDLPGKPDIVLPKYRAVILVHGCFWHGHDCSLFRWPGTQADWWRTKIEGNQARDAKKRRAQIAQGWRVLEIWECALKGRERQPVANVITQAADWLASDSIHAEVRGRLPA